MSFWTRKQTYFNQSFKGRAFQTVALRERGQLIATFDVMFGLSFHFDCLGNTGSFASLMSLLLSRTHKYNQMETTQRSCIVRNKISATISCQPPCQTTTSNLPAFASFKVWLPHTDLATLEINDLIQNFANEWAWKQSKGGVFESLPHYLKRTLFKSWVLTKYSHHSVTG